MCGIAGIVNFKENQVSEDRLRSASDLMRQRGPDYEGIWVENNCGLAHRRLSIIDLSPLGNQPMISADRRYVIAFNGEIYNFIELKNTLLKDGISFRTNSDTEVILHSWRKWGNECFGKFKGMFALAIWNPTKNELTLARDRFGEKPLYYYEDSGGVYFGSEVKFIQNLISKKLSIKFKTSSSSLIFLEV